jgi:hypothetical protein
MNTLTERRKGFDSPYKAMYEHGWDLKNLGNDYSKNLMTNSFSKYMFGNKRLEDFILLHLQPLMTFFINKVKYLRIYYNFAVPKDYQKIN